MWIAVECIKMKDVARYEIEMVDSDIGRSTMIRTGLDAGEGYYYPNLGYNRFSIDKVKLPEGFKRVSLKKKYIQEFLFDPKKKFLEKDNETYKDIKSLNEDATTYYTHDNGGRPFLMYILEAQEPREDRETQKVRIYKIPKETHYFVEDDISHDYYVELVAEYDAVNIFIGHSPLNDITKFSGGHGPRFDGNTNLLDLGDGKYVYVGEEIYEFTTDDRIIRYYSPVGNNDVPYSFAVGEKYVYFMADNAYISREIYDEKVPLSETETDGYLYYYGDTGEALSKYSQRMKGLKTIQSRLW